MSGYLRRLKNLAEKKCYPNAPSKPSKGGYEGFEGSRGKRIFSNEGAFEGFEGSQGGRFSQTLETVRGRLPVASEAPVNASAEDRRAEVEAIYARMEGERQRRRDWHAQPVEGWREGRLTIRNIVRGETTVIDLRRRGVAA